MTAAGSQTCHQPVEHESYVGAEHIDAQPAQKQNRTPMSNMQKYAGTTLQNTRAMAMRWGIPSCIAPKSEGSLGEWRGNSVHLGF